MKFILEIDLGNSGMETRDDLLMAIRDVCGRIDHKGYSMDEEIVREIMDINGNTIGYWRIKEGE